MAPPSRFALTRELSGLIAAAALSAASPTLAAATPSPSAFTPVRSLGGFTEYRLDSNGLQVLLRPDPSAPAFTLMVTYRVGSRNEVTGTTGATHLLEHMMFKGSRAYNRDLGTGFDTLLDRLGASNNATTWLDRTNYFEDLPTGHLELALQLESDRMRGLLLREADRQPEMTVVRNEYERGENDPVEALDKEITAAAFVASPYHHPTIGWRSDIERVPIGKLRQFYDTYYWPNNATVTVIGDFDPAEALRLIARYYGPIPRSPQPIPGVYTEEPPQQGARRVTVKRPGELGVVGVAYKVPGALDPDHAPLEILADILADGRTSRFYRALTDRGLTVSVDASAGFTRDGTLLTIYAQLAPEATHAAVEQALLAEIERLKQGGVTPAEVARAISKERAATAYARDGSSAIAAQVNEDIAVGDWTAYATHPQQIAAVTAADVDRVARRYLAEDQSTTGWFVPVADPGASNPGGTGAPGNAHGGPRTGERGWRPEDRRGADGSSREDGTGSAAGAAGAAAKLAPRIIRQNVAGVDLVMLTTSLRDVVTLTGSLPAGSRFNPPGNSAVADLTAGLLDRGTTAHDALALAQALEDVGATIQFQAGADNVDFSAKCLRPDLPRVLGLLAEQLRRPAFAPEEFAKLKHQLAGAYREQMGQTNFRANQALARALFPPGHPNRPPSDETYLADLARTTLDEVRAFHAAHYGPKGLVCVAVGDLGPDLASRVAGAFGGWSGGSERRAAAPAPALTAGRIERIAMPGKSSVSVVIGRPTGLRFNAPDRLALNLATEIFGGGYFSSRLLATVRNQEGLTYGIFARLADDTYADGDWRIAATFAPELLPRGLAATQRELMRLCRTGVSAGEVALFQTAVAGSYELSLGTSAGLAREIRLTVERGLPLSWLDDYPAALAALTPAQVNAAIHRYLDAKNVVTVLAGTLPPTSP
jgi:zinc protease